ncbi:MAG TPA: DUF3108 domain-containing protein, partial [Steroidobacteraceae bacterium]
MHPRPTEARPLHRHPRRARPPARVWPRAGLTLGGVTFGALLALSLAVHTAVADELKPFQASYAWIWNGMDVAVTTLRLEKIGDTWTYTTRSEPHGIGKLLSQRPKTLSVLKVADAHVQPLSYKGDDGTRSTRHTVDVKYDWDKRRISGVYEEAPVDLPLTPGVQDDASVQVAMMVELLSGHTPERFSLLDKNAVREYRYTREGEETLKTPFGDVATAIYRS